MAAATKLRPLGDRVVVQPIAREQLREAQRKAEQGSMQVQGEVQETAIEEWLAGAYPLDTVEEIKKLRQLGPEAHREYLSRPDEGAFRDPCETDSG